MKQSNLIEASGIGFCIHVVLRCGSAPDKQQVSNHEIPADSMGGKAGCIPAAHGHAQWEHVYFMTLSNMGM